MDRYLSRGTQLKTSDHSSVYEIKEIVGAGASCVVYYTDSVDANGIRTEHLLKEYNPRGLRLERDEQLCLRVCSECDEAAFKAGLDRFMSGCRMQAEVRLSLETKNSTSNIQGVFSTNGTCYNVMTVMAGKTYDKVEEKTLYDLLQRIKAITKVVRSYHLNGLLHLDIKPDNIWILPETVEMVQMFDFDSVIKKTDVATSAFLSYTQSWAAPEQLLPNRRNQICEATDLFAIGEILFNKLMGRHSETHERRSFSEITFDYSNKLFEGINPRVFPLLSEILKHTICKVVEKRYQCADELLEKLDEAISLVIPRKPFLQHCLPTQPGFFVGRDEELRELEWQLEKRDTLFISCIGGLGKSDLAKQFAFSQKERYDAVIFSLCNDDLQSLILDDRALPICYLTRGVNQKSKDYLQEKYAVLQQLCNERVLLIVDNCNNLQDETLDLLLKLNCKKLFTTRCDALEYNYPQFTIGTMKSEHVWELFCHWYKNPMSSEESAAARQIIDMYQGHTMAVELIAKQMWASCVTPTQMLKRLVTNGFRHSGAEAFVHTKDEKKEELTTYAHLRILFDVSNLTPGQMNLLINLSLIPSSGTQKSCFRDWCVLDSLDDVNYLIKSGWIREEAGNLISLHPVIADVLRDELDRDILPCTTMLTSIMTILNQDSRRLASDSLVPIASYICRRIHVLQSVPEIGIDFVASMSLILHGYGRPEDYVNYMHRIIEVYKKKEDCSSTKIAHLYNTLAHLYSVIDQYELAEKFFTKSLNIVLAICGEYHEDTAGCYNNLGCMYQEMNMFSDAQCAYEKAAKILVNKFGPEHKTVSSIYNQLGTLHCLLRELDKAEKYLQMALNIRIKVCGTDHCDTAVIYNNLGEMYLAGGFFQKAEICFVQAISIFSGILGTNHIHTAIAYCNLGTVYSHFGKTDDAKQCCFKALGIFQKLLGEKNSKVAACYNTLGALHRSAGKFEEAKLYFKKALGIMQSIYREDHSNLAIVHNQLGYLYQMTGNYPSAKDHYTQSLHIRCQRYGETHIETSYSYWNMGRFFQYFGFYSEAKSLCLKALSIWIEHYGDNHTCIGDIYYVLGGICKELHEYDSAENYYRKAFSIGSAIYPEGHDMLRATLLRIDELQAVRNITP